MNRLEKIKLASGIGFAFLFLMAALIAGSPAAQEMNENPLDRSLDIGQGEVQMTYDHDAEVVCYYRTTGGGVSCLPVNDTAYSPEDFAR